MENQRPHPSAASAKGRRISIEESLRLSHAVLHCANRGLRRVEFLREISRLLLDFSGHDALEIRLSDGDLHYRWVASVRPERLSRFEVVRWTVCEDGNVIPVLEDESDLERLCRAVASGQFDASQPFFTRLGSLWVSDTWEPVSLVPPGDAERLCIGGHHRSLAVVRFAVDENTCGLLHLKSERPNAFTEEEVEFFESRAHTLGLAIADWRVEAALRERVKELTCLYGIAQVAEEGRADLGNVLGKIVELLPPGWQYPEMTAARITLDGWDYATPGFRMTEYHQTARVLVDGRQRGAVDVVYLEERPEFGAGAFLQEEENLIAAVAREVGLIVQRREAEAQRTKLEQQLVHADRLATIGELAAGVAHELNEPLSSILGFAQLGKECRDLPEQAARDFEKVITASLYAREVIRKLMVFARQMPSQTTSVNLNEVIEDALYFLEARCSKAGAQVTRKLAPELPPVTADPAQLKQIMVNLVVNALQAMPDGGTLTVVTSAQTSLVSLVVQDTGVGMSPEVQRKIFLPFFTTKDVDEGTGLGLAVVHGIVSSHGGTIDVRSQPGQGTRFEILLPVAKSRGSEEAE